MSDSDLGLEILKILESSPQQAVQLRFICGSSKNKVVFEKTISATGGHFNIFRTEQAEQLYESCLSFGLYLLPAEHYYQRFWYGQATDVILLKLKTFLLWSKLSHVINRGTLDATTLEELKSIQSDAKILFSYEK